MALFKIFKGKDTEKLTDANATGYRVPTDGYAYYDTNSKLFYIDAAYGNDDTVITREAINANQALNGVFFGTCSTAQSTKAKVATLVNGDGFRLEKGVVVAIQFTNASAASTMTLSVNGSTAKSLMLYETSAMSSGTTTSGWRAGAIVPFVYDGTNWVRFFWENSTYYYTSAYCTTAAATQAKAGASSGVQTLTGSRYFQLWIQNTNTYAGAITLNMNSLGAKLIYINGQPSSSTNYNLLRGCYIVYYDATGNNGNGCYHFRTDEKIPGNLAGNADTATYATTAGSVDNETDPVFQASAAAGITSTDISNWNSKTSNTGTVTKVTAGTGLSIGSTAGGNFTTSGTINHTNSVTAQGTQALYPIKIDAQGHISAYGTAVTSLPASDVYAWAKAATKPTYAWNEISQTGADKIQEGTSDFTDNTEIFSSYASNNGFADTNAAGQVYRRDAVKMYNYIKNKLAVTNNNISVSWNTETTIATIGGTAIKIKIPANPSVLESVTASGTAPLTLSAGTITNKSIAISGSIADASTSAKGVVKIGDGISVSNGTISVTASGLGLSSAMLFKGSLGTGGTITSLPTAAAGNTGYTYKVITAGTYASQAAKVGDVFVSNGSSWILIPSGDEPSGTVTSVGVSNATNGGLTVTSSPITTSGTISIGHTNVLTNAQTTQALYPIKIDKNGHISAYGTAVTSLPASDVSAWAKAATKPNYTFSEIGSKPTTLSGYGITDAVTNIAYNSSTYNITKTINGTTSNVLQMPCRIGTGTNSLIAGDLANNTASGESSFAAGGGFSNSGTMKYQVASGKFSFTAGSGNTVSGDSASAFGINNTVSNKFSVAMGSTNTVASQASFVGGGNSNITSGANYSIAYGYQTEASAGAAVAFGSMTKAKGAASMAIGQTTIASAACSLVSGLYNIEDTGTASDNPFNTEIFKKYAFIVGNGSSANARSNALTVDWYGNLAIAGSLNWNSISNTPTTVAGYGITDVPTISIVRW